MEPALTKTETAELGQHERTIERGLGTFRDVGAALLAIRDGKLYRAEHKTFETYCKSRWNFDRHYAHRLIVAHETDQVLPIGNKPKNEAQVRPLTSLPKEDRAEAWEQVRERAPRVNGEPKITAKLVQEVVDEWEADEEVEDQPREMYDYLDQPVPEEAQQAFNDEHFIDDAIGQLRVALRAGEALAESAAGKFLNLKQYRASLKEAKAILEATRPFAVCPYCNGRKCSACGQVGVVPKEVHQAQ